MSTCVALCFAAHPDVIVALQMVTPSAASDATAPIASQHGAPMPAPAADAERDLDVLGAGDQISIRVVDVDEVAPGSSPVRIDGGGFIALPLVGRVRAAGRTPEQLQVDIAARLKKYVKEPDVTVWIVETRSQPISVLGAVQSPGVHQLQGQKTLFEVLSLAGGLGENAGNRVRITRRLEWGAIPLPDAVTDDSGQFSIATVNVQSIMSATDPTANILVKPNDVISVPKADVVYVVGAVQRAGAFVLGESNKVTALQAVSLAGGLGPAASAKGAKVLRVLTDTKERVEIEIGLNDILDGEVADFDLQKDDILFVPTSGAKRVGARTLEAMISVLPWAFVR